MSWTPSLVSDHLLFYPRTPSQEAPEVSEVFFPVSGESLMAFWPFIILGVVNKALPGFLILSGSFPNLILSSLSCIPYIYKEIVR